MNKYLIIVRAGDNSLHTNWIKGEDPHFDLFISYFGNEKNKFRDHAKYYEEKKGGKWPEISRILAEHKELINQYEAIWLPDDDLMINAKDINKMFSFFKAFDLDLAQPALSLDSYYAHRQLLKRKHTIIRFCNFVEVMAPIFSKKGLKQLSKTFSQSKSGWGLDYLWPKLIENHKEKIAIIDAVTIIHTRPIGGELYKLNPELNPNRDIDRIVELYPKLNISPRDKSNNFRVYSQVKIHSYLYDLIALFKGRYQKKYYPKM